jgi:hypothetical protein
VPANNTSVRQPEEERQTEIQEFFDTLGLSTDEQRASKRFDDLLYVAPAARPVYVPELSNSSQVLPK